MPALSPLLCAAMLAVICLGPPAQSPQAGPSQQGPGHLVLVVHGTAQSLTVVHVAAKPSPWTGSTKGLKSDFALRILDGNGRQIGRVPMDLSHFDTRDDRVGTPDRSECCKVLTSRIGLLLNIPDLQNAKSYQFVRKDRVIGTVLATRIAELRGGR